MSDNQNDMFGVSSSSSDILAHLGDNIEEVKHSWPQALAELVDVLSECRKKQGVAEDTAQKEGLQLALEIADYFGGMQFYLPKAITLKNEMRNIQIWHEFTGRNVKELARKHKLTEVCVYKIIRTRMQLHRNKIQPDMFKEKA
jgi:Mor family transcriptional regulator